MNDPGASVRAGRWRPTGVSERQWLATVVFTVAAGAVILWVLSAPRPQEGRELLIPLVGCFLVFFLRRWPLPVLALTAGLALTLTIAGNAILPPGILLAVAMYSAALSMPRSRSIVVAVAIAVALSAAVVYSAVAVRTSAPPAEATVDLVPLAGAWFMADSVAARRRYQAGLAAQAERERAAEVSQERVRIAREMHDVVAHALAVITVQAGVGRCLADTRPDEASSALGSIETISRTAQDELRVMLGLLRDEDSGTAPLTPAPRLADIKDLADTVRTAGIDLDLRMDGTDRELSPSLELSIYRVVQEALTNIVKHAPGARAVAELTVSDTRIRLDIRNDGGPDQAEPRTGMDTGHGITGMRERTGAFGGWLVAGPLAGGGFEVTAEIPVKDVVD
jgi:signal transduction histidine kinase